jgi:hypothetical protein
MKSSIELYLEWVNDWLTVERMAEHYDLTTEQMLDLIEKGRLETTEL